MAYFNDPYHQLGQPITTTNVSGTITMNPGASTTLQMVRGPQLQPSPLTIQKIENGYVVYPADLYDTNQGNRFDYILSQMAFFADLTAAHAYITTKWAGMLDQADEPEPEPEPQYVTTSTLRV